MKLVSRASKIFMFYWTLLYSREGKAVGIWIWVALNLSSRIKGRHKFESAIFSKVQVSRRVWQATTFGFRIFTEFRLEVVFTKTKNYLH